MPIELANSDIDGSIPVHLMQDGDIAVITTWWHKQYLGRIVQRYGNFLMAVGLPQGFGFGILFPDALSDAESSQTCRVRILPPGTLLRITNT